MWSLCGVLIIFYCIHFFVKAEDYQYVCNTFLDYLTLNKCKYNPDIGDNVHSVIKRHGYTSSTYQSVTEDGYILNIVRVSTERTPTKGVVFLQHPYAVGSVVWVDKGNKSLAFNLADMGYDVWLGNSRGTRLSSKHVSLSWKDAKYWDYSFHEIGVYDFPAMLRLVKNITNSKVTFIGYSAAGTSALIFASILKDFANDNVDLFVTISPALTLGKTFSSVSPVLRELASTVGERNLQYTMQFTLRFLLRYIPVVIPLFFYIFSSITVEELYPPFIALLFHAMPDGANTKQVDHYSQIAISKKFRKYDYGIQRNMLLYNEKQPPEYPLRDIQVPFHIIYGNQDALFGPKDAQVLYKELLPSARYGQPYNIGNFNHVDFGYGREVYKVSEYICRLLNRLHRYNI